MFQSAPQQPYSEPRIIVDGETLKAVDDFSYLGSTVSTSVNIDSEVDKRITKSSTTFGRLRASVWDRRGIKQKTKLKVYKAAVLLTLLYACETVTVYERHAQKLNRFHINCLRKLLKLNWKDRVPGTDVPEQAGMTSLRTLLQQAQLGWTGHILRRTRICIRDCSLASYQTVSAHEDDQSCDSRTR